MRQIYKTRYFTRWATSERLTDNALVQAVNEMDAGLVDAKLGSGICKKRVALEGKGKRSGARVLVAYQREQKVFFMYGFSKAEKKNIDHEALVALKKLAKELFGYTEREIKKAVDAEALIEVM
jgi:hypothetical protein